MNKMIILSAPSGAGKTTIVREIMKNPKLNLMFSVSATSRDPREYERNGEDYYFFNLTDFKTRIKNNEFLEWEQVYENQYYGTLKSEINRIWELNKNVIFDVDVIGGINIKNHYKENALSIFIKPPSIEELENRLNFRGTENPESLKKRLDKAKYELSFADKFDKIIINDILENSITKTTEIITKFLFN